MANVANYMVTQEVAVYRADVDTPGLAIVDRACQRTMNGLDWRVTFGAELGKRGLRGLSRPTVCSITGVGGTATATEVVTWPVGLFGQNGTIDSLQVPGSA